MKKYFLLALLFLTSAVNAAEEPVAAVIQGRNKELDAAKKEYENRISEIDAVAIEKLVVIMKNKISAKDFEGAKLVKQAILSIEKPQAGTQVQEDPAVVKPEERIVLKTQPLPQNKPKTEADKYPEGSFKKFGHYYYTFPVPMNYEDAKSACVSLGGHLLSLNSDEEYDFFQKAAIKDGKAFWLDLHYNGDKKSWEKWDGKKAIFVKWQNGFPAEIEKGAVTVIFNYANKKTDMVNVPGRTFTGIVVCEWEN